MALLWGSARLGRLGHGVCLEYDRIPYSIGEMAIAQMFRNTVPVYTLLSYGCASLSTVSKDGLLCAPCCWVPVDAGQPGLPLCVSAKVPPRAQRAACCVHTSHCPSSAPPPHTACPSHLSSSSSWHGPSLPSLRSHRLDISATTYHPSGFMTPAAAAAVGSRCVYLYDARFLFQLCVAEANPFCPFFVAF